jgi:hypothetical protein
MDLFPKGESEACRAAWDLAVIGTLYPSKGFGEETFSR